ncbi:PEP-CTERM sorting domain-containing protein [Rhizomicrobium electricum]|uniref:Ice-binding protein C-terminal domain-containing protein n=1 Tax=Rhizomicrobium electricum TaxID=480070 RepID=A0ABP3Q304_9PROT|nr:PEP-CTERM sorting domain-containing protein [Rhizomicrobium electricum]NIJ50154.1 hypothetical protein [Rhizomicrobium electricum]
MFSKWWVALAAVGAITAAQAEVIPNQFDFENGGTPTLNYTGFANFIVSAGSVDLIGDGDYDWAFPGNGLYVDLAGSTGAYGALQTKTVYGPGTYMVTIGLGGPIYSGMNDGAILSWASGSKSWDFAGLDQITDSFLVTLTSASSFKIADAGKSGNANIGATLFGIDIGLVSHGLPLPPPPAVPEPLTIMLLGAGLAGVFGLRRVRNQRGNHG